jgi:hypothetical protein
MTSIQAEDLMKFAAPIQTSALAAAGALPVETVGIIIRDRDATDYGAYPIPRVDAFVYGEYEPKPPTLPFGRWKDPR